MHKKKSQTGGSENWKTIVCFLIHSRFGWRQTQKLLRFSFFFFLYFQSCQFPQEMTGCFNSLLRVALNPDALRAVAERVRNICIYKYFFFFCQTNVSAFQESWAPAAGRKWWKTLWVDPVAKFQISALTSEGSRAGLEEDGDWTVMKLENSHCGSTVGTSCTISNTIGSTPIGNVNSKKNLRDKFGTDCTAIQSRRFPAKYYRKTLSHPGCCSSLST